MAQQKSEDRDKPQGRRKPVVTRGVESRAGGEAIPVDEVPKQLLLFTGTADALARASGRGEADRSLERPATRAVLKPVTRGKTAKAATTRWALSHTSTVDRALRNSYWDARGLVSIEQRWKLTRASIVAPTQLRLGLG